MERHKYGIERKVKELCMGCMTSLCGLAVFVCTVIYGSGWNLVIWSFVGLLLFILPILSGFLRFNKGRIGEWIVSSRLRKGLPENEYTILNDVYLPIQNNETTQIDHIVVSRFGVFVVETKNFTDMSPSNFFKTEGDFDAAVTGLYLPLTTNWGYSDGGTGGWYTSLFNADMSSYFSASLITGDVMRSYSTHPYAEFNVGPSTNGAISTTYNVLRFVARATDVINQMENSNGATEVIRSRYIAEAKILRAFYMYTLFDFFGPLNVKLNPSTLMNNEIEPRPSSETYIGYIEKDLNDALATVSLPDRYNDNPDEWGRWATDCLTAMSACSLRPSMMSSSGLCLPTLHRTTIT